MAKTIYKYKDKDKPIWKGRRHGTCEIDVNEWAVLRGSRTRKPRRLNRNGRITHDILLLERNTRIWKYNNLEKGLAMNIQQPNSSTNAKNIITNWHGTTHGKKIENRQKEKMNTRHFDA